MLDAGTRLGPYEIQSALGAGGMGKQGDADRQGNPTVASDMGGGGLSGIGARYYDVSPDGQRFLVIRDASTAEKSAPAELHVLLNWDEELKRLAPAKK